LTIHKFKKNRSYLLSRAEIRHCFAFIIAHLELCFGSCTERFSLEIPGPMTDYKSVARPASGVLAVRAGKNLDLDGQKMEATNAPEAARLVRTEYRKKWLG
jgi:hypothetical protein